MASEQLWCATPTPTLCCWSKESWIDDVRQHPLSRSGIRADRAKLNQHGREYRRALRVSLISPVTNSHQHNGRADHVGGALLTSGASGHKQFLVVKPNQPKDDGD